MKQFVALARVSSREQEREGFSLEVQEDALKRYATQAGGEIVKLFKIAETASKSDERKSFRELINFTRKNAPGLDGLLFYKVDRAARNLFDYVELERIESEFGVPFISVSQPTECTPAGRMMRRTLANMASFYTEQQSVDVREGLSRRVQEGWFVGKAPYGYRNVRKNGRSLIEFDPQPADNVRRIFQLFAYEPLTIDGVIERLDQEGRTFRTAMPKFPRSSIHNILHDRAYIGEIEFKGQWYAGKHEPLVDRATWDRVQQLLGTKIYRAHELTYASSLIVCGHCGHFITGEQITRRFKSGDRSYVYYRCTKYAKSDHPRVRLTEADIDAQVLALFDQIKIGDEAIREWFQAVLRSQTRDAQAETQAMRAELQRQLTTVQAQQDRLINMRLMDEIAADVFARKQTEFRDREASLKLQMEVVDRSQHEIADLAVRVFELSQTLKEKWLAADYTAKRQILEIVCLNFRLDGTTLVCERRKPFDVIVEGLSVSSSRAGGI